MYCKIKNKECPNAGQITIKGDKELGEQEGIYKYTVCYKEGGWVNCE